MIMIMIIVTSMLTIIITISKMIFANPTTSIIDWEFDDYRRNQSDAAMVGTPDIVLSQGDGTLQLAVTLSLDGLDTGMPYHVTAVTEELGMPINALWAKQHAGDTPDFHNRACFAESIPPVDAP